MNDAFTSFFVGVAVGIIIGVVISAVMTAIRNAEDFRQANLDPSRLENLDAAIEYYCRARNNEPYGSESYNKLTEDINCLRRERDIEYAKFRR